MVLKHSASPLLLWPHPSHQHQTFYSPVYTKAQSYTPPIRLVSGSLRDLTGVQMVDGALGYYFSIEIRDMCLFAKFKRIKQFLVLPSLEETPLLSNFICTQNHAQEKNLFTIHGHIPGLSMGVEGSREASYIDLARDAELIEALTARMFYVFHFFFRTMRCRAVSQFSPELCVMISISKGTLSFKCNKSFDLEWNNSIFLTFLQVC